MPKELYLYNALWSSSAENLISQLEANAGEDIVLRVNSPGGSVFAGWGIIAKMLEKETGKITIKVDGGAMSMASFILLFADRVEALEVSTIMIHRADGPVDSASDQAFLDKVNKDLRSKMEKRINSEKLKEIAGYTIAELFENKERIDINLTAKQAKMIGLVDQVNKVTPKEIEAIEAYGKYFEIAAEDKTNNSNKSTPMTIEEIKANHPALYAQIISLGAKQEQDRVLAWAHFASVDAEAVKKGIESGAVMSQVQMIEFMEKKTNVKAIGDLKDESDGNKTKDTKAEGDKEKEKVEANKKNMEEFRANMNTYTGVKVYQ